MGLYEGGLFKVSRKLDGKGRLQLPGDFREAVGFALDEEVEIAAVMLKDSKKAALMITRKEGKGQELYHMEEGDFAVIFPDVIHHYQVFSPGENKAVYLWAKPVLIGKFADIIQNSCPEDPVIKKEQVHPDIVNAVRCLRANRKEKDDNLAVEQAYVQIPGFESQRTFNRVFRERYRMTPREYRTLYKEKYLREEQT